MNWKIFCLAAALGCLTLAAGENSRMDEYTAAWKEVEQATAKGRPRTALKALAPILETARRRGDWAQWTKAVIRRVVLEAEIQGGAPEEKIRRLAPEIDKAPEPVRPLLEAVQAHWFWQYFQRNRWRILQRSATAEPPGEDFTTWDIKRLFAEIDRRFARALGQAALLKEIPVAEFDGFLLPGSLPDRFRPTLYDFIAHEALKFYTSGEQAGAQPEAVFEIAAEDPVFDEIKAFLAWSPSAPDTNAPLFKAARIFQDLLRFHLRDEDPSALADADLARLKFACRAAWGEEKDSRCLKALRRFAERWADHEISAVAWHEIGSRLFAQKRYVEAREAALRGAQTYPESPGGRLCANLVRRIEAPEVSLQIERNWWRPWPKIHVRCRNVSNLWFRIVRVEWKPTRETLSGRTIGARPAERAELLAKPPLFAWRAELPPTKDFQPREADLDAPEDLGPGFYALLASRRPDFREKDNRIEVSNFRVTRLALVARACENRVEGWVLDAESGEPIPGAQVRLWTAEKGPEPKPSAPLETDAGGWFEFQRESAPRGCWVVARKGAWEVDAGRRLWPARMGEARPFKRTFLFTDRAIYRPGQLIHYKGVCVFADQAEGDYHTLAGEEITIQLRGPNGRVAAEHRHRASGFGSFHGVFAAPETGLRGRFTLQVSRGPSGRAVVRVEEYKRPKFYVTLDPPKAPAKLDREVQVQGKALAFTGAPIDSGKVRYRVVRRTRLPWWWGRFGWPPRPAPADREIAHGVVALDKEGRFVISFRAVPDRSVPKAAQPVFAFEVHADVTDAAGETRSAGRTVHAGYQALSLRAETPDWIEAGKPFEIRIAAANLDGAPQIAEGVLKAFRLKQPQRPIRKPYWLSTLRTDAEAKPGSDPASWPAGESVWEGGFSTDAEGRAKTRLSLPAGAYRLRVLAQDASGEPVKAEALIKVVDPEAERLDLRVPFLLAASGWSGEPGEEVRVLWGSGYERARACFELFRRGKLLERFWTDPRRTQQELRLRLKEAWRGGVTLHVFQVRENRIYEETRRIDVPWSNKELAISWERFRSKLRPGQTETWSLVIRPKAKGAKDPAFTAAEMVAALYDASLDQFAPHRWPDRIDVFYRDYWWAAPSFSNRAQGFLTVFNDLRLRLESVELSYRRFPPEVNSWSPPGRYLRKAATFAPGAPAPQMAVMAKGAPAEMENVTFLGAPPSAEDRPPAPRGGLGGGGEGSAEAPAPAIDLSAVVPRRNLQETAFFYPDLLSDSNGVARIRFQTPEALTQWRFLGFAHDTALRSGGIQALAVTAKELMVRPNPPRFLREGDQLEFTVKVVNRAEARQKGRVRLDLLDAFTEKPVGRALGVSRAERPFDIPPRESRVFAWRLRVPDGLNSLLFRAVAASAEFSDGEEDALPVLPRRVAVEESLPLPVRGPAEKQFVFTNLLRSAESSSLRHQALVVQMSSNPAWYAVLALPYLMEFPHECAEQLFNRIYADSLGSRIVRDNPRIRSVFEQWRRGGRLKSPLEQNADLRSVLLDETPWLLEGRSESEARARVALFFDENRMSRELEKAIRKLGSMQTSSGLWPWFPGGRGNMFVTLYIVAGLGRLQDLGAAPELPKPTLAKAIQALDEAIRKRYERIVEEKTEQKPRLDPTVAFYLYGRSFFLERRPIPPPARKAVDYFLDQARRHWLKLPRMAQGHAALGLLRFGDPRTARDIAVSLKERSVLDEELGRFWRDTELSWSWFRAPIETQALMIEVFEKVLRDRAAVDECRVWLLKQKQTQAWKTTKATADAVYALLDRGSDWLGSKQLVRVSLGGEALRPSQVEAGTGFYEVRFGPERIAPELARITVKKPDPGVAWGAVHWRYLEEIGKIPAYAGTPLKIEKRFYVRKLTAQGPTLAPVRGPVRVGDELAVRLVLRVDRDMEFVHLRDQRPSCVEPQDVLSRRLWRDGLSYYMSVRDSAVHFFIDYLPKGTYVLEYRVWARHRGVCQSGYALVECMYAPEFNSHSAGFLLRVE